MSDRYRVVPTGAFQEDEAACGCTTADAGRAPNPAAAKPDAAALATHARLLANPLHNHRPECHPCP